MFEIELTLKGERPLVVQSDRRVNPLDPLARELARFTSKRKKTEDDHEIISRIEFESGLYWDAELGPYLPTANIHKSLVQGARQSKEGRQIEQGCFPLIDRSPILYEGPRTIEELYQSPEHVYKTSVGIGQKRTMRTRARFPQWAVTTPFALDPEKVDADVFQRIADTAGRFIGIGERRPMFGAFTAYIDLNVTKGSTSGRVSAV